MVQLIGARLACLFEYTEVVLQLDATLPLDFPPVVVMEGVGEETLYSTHVFEFLDLFRLRSKLFLGRSELQAPIICAGCRILEFVSLLLVILNLPLRLRQLPVQLVKSLFAVHRGGVVFVCVLGVSSHL